MPEGRRSIAHSTCSNRLSGWLAGWLAGRPGAMGSIHPPMASKGGRGKERRSDGDGMLDMVCGMGGWVAKWSAIHGRGDATVQGVCVSSSQHLTVLDCILPAWP